MIYLDNAATSFHKPTEVYKAVKDAMYRMSSPGRGAYPSAMAAAECLLDCRTEMAKVFCVESPERVVFTHNATESLNIAIRDIVKANDRVVISAYEHNSVTRPLHALGARIDVAEGRLFDPGEILESFEKKLPGADACICTHVSNVFGYILPISEIAGLCEKHGVPLIVDASQSAGILPIDFSAWNAAYCAMPGHKGLLGPQGTGVLLCGRVPDPILFGGTGSDSLVQTMPDYLPDRLESGTHNVPGIAGLLAACRWIEKSGLEAIAAQEKRLMRCFVRELKHCEKLDIYSSDNMQNQIGVVSLNVRGKHSERIAEALSEQGIAVRAGLHCAPLAHQNAGTLQSGTVRFSFSCFNTLSECQVAAQKILDLVG